MNSIFWFRQDLRLSDNPGLIAAANSGQVLPIYIWDEKESIGSASKIYLYHSLNNLNQSLNNKLNFYIGDPKVIIQELVERYNITGVFCNKCYEPYYVTNDTDIDCLLQEKKIKFNIFDASYLWNPENI